MQKDTYYYNRHTLKYEKVKKTWTIRIWQILGFFASTIFFAFIIVTIGYSFITPPSQASFEESLKEVENDFLVLNKRIDALTEVVNDIEDRDDNIYRVIFEASPIPSQIRYGKIDAQQKFKQLSKFSKSDLIKNTSQKIKNLERRIYVQSKSYDQLEGLFKTKSKYLESVPAIQPVSNVKLKRIASGFGVRIDPIYKTPKLHAGLDFSAPIGTEIYATGNGVVEIAGSESDGYGLKVVIKHGYDYQTLYAHCSKILVRRGQKVKRGQKIALIGSTGKSTGPHLHYEVIKKGIKIDPVNFFFNDLTPNEYNQVVKMAEQNNQAFD